ncbi:hypothetical protein ABK040_000484 [Willaertia magna]
MPPIPLPPKETIADAKTLLFKQDQEHKKLLIPQTITNHTIANSDFEIYLGGMSTVGGLMIGSAIIINEEDENKKYKNYKLDSTFPYFIKFTRENIPVPLQNDEFIEFIGSGARYLIIITNLLNCYLFGNFLTEGKLNYNFCKVLQFKINDNNTLQKKLNCKITHLVTAPQFIVLKDEFNRFWYCGKTNFGAYSYYINYSDIIYNEFIQLNIGDTLQQELNNENNKVTKIVTGETHVLICINNKFIYGIGNNKYSQLGVKQNETFNLNHTNLDCINKYNFVKADWNLNGEYTVKQLECSNDETIILTKCGKIFASTRHYYWNTFKLIETTEKPIRIFIDCHNIRLLTENNQFLYMNGNYIGEDYSNFYELVQENKQMNNKQIKFGKALGIESAKKWSAMYCDKDIYFMKDNKDLITLRMDWEITSVCISGEINLIFCFKKKSNLFKQILFSSAKELSDIDIYCF